MTFFPVLLSMVIMSTLVGACQNLPAMQYVGSRAYILQQRMECRGGKVYDIDNVRDIDQCKNACREFDCAAVNLFQLGEFSFKCEILGTLYGMTPATGSACYYASDLAAGIGGMGGLGGWGGLGMLGSPGLGGYGPYGRRRK